MPGMTITEKILAKHAKKNAVQPGENIWVDVDILMTHDVCGPGTIGIFHEKFGRNAKVWDPDKVVIIPDHYIFTKEEICHSNIQILRDFVKEQGLKYYYDPEFVLGTGKLCLKVPPTMKFVFHGQIPAYLTAKDLILAVIGEIGVDGATYRAMYFTGDGIKSLTLEDRMTLTNMAIEAGGKNGVCDVDEKTLAYVNNRSNLPNWEVVKEDGDAKYVFDHEWDLSTMEPMVAKPHSPDNKDTAYNCRSVKVDRAYIGSCTGGKITDMIFAASILKGNKVKVPTFVVPGSTEVHADMKRLNLVGVPKDGNEKSIEEILLDSGCLVGPSGCSACLGGPADTFGRLQSTETCISTTNRNFPGRMGSKNAAVYLASPLTVAASALTGHVTDPREYVTTKIDTGIAGVV